MQWARLVGDPAIFTIQSRIFHGFCIFGISVNFIETVSNNAKFLSLGTRLFANLFAGHILLKVLYVIGYEVSMYADLLTSLAVTAITTTIYFIIFLELLIERGITDVEQLRMVYHAFFSVLTALD